jgi:Flp pilus assembly secretin CpaC
MRKRNGSVKIIFPFVLLTGIIWGAIFPLKAQEAAQYLKIGLSKSEIVQFRQPIIRISIADPEIADVLVTSPNQVLVNGKSLGSTSMVVWDEYEQYTPFEVAVHSEASTHQVNLQVRFAEVRRGVIKEYGINFLLKDKKIGSETFTWGSFAGKVVPPSDPIALGETVDMFLGISSQNFTAVIKALEENNLLTMLAKPNLSAVNGAEASFLAGGEFPVPVASGSIGGGQSISIQFKEFGVLLKFVPTVLDSELVNIKVNAEVSNLDFENAVEISGFRIPSLVTRRTETIVELKEGENLVIGGLLGNEVAKSISKFPLLGDIPVLGALFKSTRFRNNETELVIMITPNIIKYAGL